MDAALSYLHALWQPKRLRYTILTGALVILLLFLVTNKHTPTISTKHQSPRYQAASNETYFKPHTSNPQFHLVVPATSSNKHLCRLLLSLTALNYPAPIFVRWGTPEAQDPYVQHLAKVEGVLRYLGRLPKDQDEDIVLIADGYDILFQLGPDVLLKRYFDIIHEQNRGLTQRFGKQMQEEYDVTQSIIIGADKISWPDDPTLPSSWAVPDSTLPRYAFGPQTDTGHWRHHNRPRWLNSGTIMGPIGHVRALFQATFNKIQYDHTTDSDQFYFAQVFAEQSYARTLLIDGPLKNRTRKHFHPGYFSGAGFEETVTLKSPHLEPGQTTEYHVTLDYESKLFQTTAYYHQYLGWRKHRLSENYEQQSLDMPVSSDGFPTDILAAPSPFPDGWPDASQRSDSQNQGNETLHHNRAVSWRDLPLGTNGASGEIFGLLHHTPPKELRDVWYPRLWFFPYSEAIMRSALSSRSNSSRHSGNERGSTQTKSFITRIGNAEWHRFAPTEPRSAKPGLRVGGGFTEAGEWQDWDSLCKNHEDSVFRNTPESGNRPWPYRLAPTSTSEESSTISMSLTSSSSFSATAEPSTSFVSEESATSTSSVSEESATSTSSVSEESATSTSSVSEESATSPSSTSSIAPRATGNSSQDEAGDDEDDSEHEEDETNKRRREKRQEKRTHQATKHGAKRRV